MMDPAIRPDPLDGAFSARELMRQHFPPVEYVVPGVIPEGLTLLTAAPKIGKSWMVLLIAQTVATGEEIFGSIPVRKRPVLYLALEDGKRRLQERLHTLGVSPDGEPGLIFLTTLEAPAPDVIQAFLDRHPGENPLIILDTLGKVRGVYSGNDAYQKDYGQMSTLKNLVDAHPGSSLIVVHHTKKAETTDFLDSVSGTQGLAGAADSILVIRRERHTGEAVLHVTSRDAAEGEYAMTFTDGVWSMEGNSLSDARHAVERRRATAGLGDAMTELVNAVANHPEGISRKDLEPLVSIKPAQLGVYLKRAVEGDRIGNPSRGLYTPVTSVMSVTTSPSRDQLVTEVTDITPSHDRESAPAAIQALPDTDGRPTDSSDTLTPGMVPATHGFCQRFGCNLLATQGRKYCTHHDGLTERLEADRQEAFS